MVKLLRGSSPRIDSKTWVPERRYRPDLMPNEGWGECTVHECCTVTFLANGYCVEHWDKDLDNNFTIVE
jgi:hypothetical protein